MRKILIMLFRWTVYILLSGIGLLTLTYLISNIYAAQRIYSVENAPVKRSALIFGAGLWRDGSPTPILKDRVRAGAQLFFAGKVEKLLMSGDNSYETYNEPAAMKTYAMSLGVPEEAIVLDYAGRRTYDTCYRAKHIFNVDDIILVTQKFHLPRALLICNALGINAIGVESDLQTYRKGSLFFWNAREILANFNAFIDIYITKPIPILGNPEPIFKD